MPAEQVIKAEGNMLRKIISTCIVLAAPVVAVATEYRTVERPRQECWNEQAAVQSGSQGIGGAVVGGIAGGLIGNQIGGGNGKTVATAVGAATGAVILYDDRQPFLAMDRIDRAADQTLGIVARSA